MNDSELHRILTEPVPGFPFTVNQTPASNSSSPATPLKRSRDMINGDAKNNANFSVLLPNKSPIIHSQRVKRPRQAAMNSAVYAIKSSDSELEEDEEEEGFERSGSRKRVKKEGVGKKVSTVRTAQEKSPQDNNQGKDFGTIMKVCLEYDYWNVDESCFSNTNSKIARANSLNHARMNYITVFDLCVDRIYLIKANYTV